MIAEIKCKATAKSLDCCSRAGTPDSGIHCLPSSSRFVGLQGIVEGLCIYSGYGYTMGASAGIAPSVDIAYPDRSYSSVSVGISPP